MVVQWNTNILSTDKNEPRCLLFLQKGSDLEPVTVTFRFVSCKKKTCVARVTSLGHNIVKNSVVSMISCSTEQQGRYSKDLSVAGVTDRLRGSNYGFFVSFHISWTGLRSPFYPNVKYLFLYDFFFRFEVLASPKASARQWGLEFFLHS